MAAMAAKKADAKKADAFVESILREQAGHVAVRLVKAIREYESDTFIGRNVTMKQATAMALRMLQDAARIRDGVQLTNYLNEVRR
jgi:Zn-dependent metalloprotease